MIGRNSRGWRLEAIAGVGIALALCTHAASAQGVGTTTTLAASTSPSSAQTNPAAAVCQLTTATVSVTSAQGAPAGTVTIQDGITSPVTLGSQKLNASGQASFTFALAKGSHNLIAQYTGSGSYNSSVSPSQAVTVSSQCTSPYAVTISSLQPSSTLTAGQTATAVVIVTPLPDFLQNLGSTPGFITLSCSSLPEQTACFYSPSNVEILPGQAEGVTSNISLQTQASGTAMANPPAGGNRRSAPIAWALLLPGMLGLGGLAWGSRRRAWLNRLVLLALVGLVATLGMTACSPLYFYHNHGPPANNPTPSGSYNAVVTAQSSNGVATYVNSTSFSFTVK